ncbi:MAG: alpha-amylase family glycosyl hydrolase [Promethearchaeota archaeon]
MSSREINWPKHPKILEINTWPWLNSLSEKYKLNKLIKLNNIPDEVLENDFKYFNVIWLMGVWERSPQGRNIAIEHPDLQDEYRKALKDLSKDDIVGSPYSVHYYRVDKYLGGNAGLDSFREKLKDRGMLLILDYVPNHVAVDHMWTLLKTDLFIKGTEEDLVSSPNEFFKAVDQVYANGKDPYFPSWTDTIQINAFSSEAREKAIFTLSEIAEHCDGVRCDMAMLMTNKVFSKTWGERAGPIPEKEFWVEVIEAVRNKSPSFKFLAEVYWDMEWELQQQGFDFCYDKRLYDRMIHDKASFIREHLKAEWDYQTKLVRFIENHDEKRAIEVFGEKKSKAAAVIALTLPGARLVHEGQVYGYTIKLPIQLGRRFLEEKNPNITKFYENLLKAAPGREFNTARWSLCRVDQISNENRSSTNLIAYLWFVNELYQLIVVNFSPYPSQGHIRIDEIDYGISDWNFSDLLTQKTYTYNGQNLGKFGLYIDLLPWKAHIFDIKRLTS